MASLKYGPFRDGRVETGENAKCPCGKGNKHSLREGGACDWQRRPAAERAAIVAKAAAKAAGRAA